MEYVKEVLDFNPIQFTDHDVSKIEFAADMAGANVTAKDLLNLLRAPTRTNVIFVQKMFFWPAYEDVVFHRILQLFSSPRKRIELFSAALLDTIIGQLTDREDKPLRSLFLLISQLGITEKQMRRLFDLALKTSQWQRTLSCLIIESPEMSSFFYYDKPISCGEMRPHSTGFSFQTWLRYYGERCDVFTLGSLTLSVDHDTAQLSAGSSCKKFEASRLEPGALYHIVLTCRKTADLFINGELVQSISMTFPHWRKDHTLIIGSQDMEMSNFVFLDPIANDWVALSYLLGPTVPWNCQDSIPNKFLAGPKGMIMKPYKGSLHVLIQKHSRTSILDGALKHSSTPIESVIYSVGGFRELLKILSVVSANDLSHCIDALTYVVHKDWRMAREFDSSHKLIRVILRERTINLGVLESVLKLLGYSSDSPEESIIWHPLAFKSLVADFSTWSRSNEAFKYLLFQLTVFAQHSKFHLLNTEKLFEMGIVTQIIQAFKLRLFPLGMLPEARDTLSMLVRARASEKVFEELCLYVTYALDKAHNDEASSVLDVIVSFSCDPDTLSSDGDHFFRTRLCHSLSVRWSLFVMKESKDIKPVRLSLRLLLRLLTVLGKTRYKRFLAHGGLEVLASYLKRFPMDSSMCLCLLAATFGLPEPAGSILQLKTGRLLEHSRELVMPELFHVLNCAIPSELLDEYVSLINERGSLRALDNLVSWYVKDLCILAGRFPSDRLSICVASIIVEIVIKKGPCFSQFLVALKENQSVRDVYVENVSSDVGRLLHTYAQQPEELSPQSRQNIAALCELTLQSQHSKNFVTICITLLEKLSIRDIFFRMALGSAFTTAVVDDSVNKHPDQHFMDLVLCHRQLTECIDGPMAVKLVCCYWKHHPESLGLLVKMLGEKRVAQSFESRDPGHSYALFFRTLPVDTEGSKKLEEIYQQFQVENPKQKPGKQESPAVTLFEASLVAWQTKAIEGERAKYLIQKEEQQLELENLQAVLTATKRDCFSAVLDSIEVMDRTRKLVPNPQVQIRDKELVSSIQGVWNVTRIIGLEAMDGVLIMGPDSLHLASGTFHNGSIVSSPKQLRDPYMRMVMGNSTTRETQAWAVRNLVSVSKRQFLLRDVALEFFFLSGENFLITSSERDAIHDTITRRITALMADKEMQLALSGGLSSWYRTDRLSSVTEKWRIGEISNFSYLMMLNTFAGRTWNDLTQYPVFPWVLSDYASEAIDLSNAESYRDLTKNMGSQGSERAKQFEERFEAMKSLQDDHPFHFGTHYSSAMIVSSFLVRLKPFVDSYLLLQGGKFDIPDRLFHSIGKSWLSCSRDNTTDVRELVPEFFYMPEFLINGNNLDMGSLQDGTKVMDVELPPWAKGNPKLFIEINRRALESEYVSSNLHHWIDLIFGYKQRGKLAEENINCFHHLSYRGAVDLDKIDNDVDRQAVTGIIHNFGQTPQQIFGKPHAQRSWVACAVDFSPIKGIPVVSFSNVVPVARLEFHRFWKARSATTYRNQSKVEASIFSTLIVNGNVHEYLEGSRICWCEPLGDFILCGCESGNITMYSSEVLPINVFRGHLSRITAIKSAPFYNAFVSLDADGTVILWDSVRLELVKRLVFEEARAIAICNHTGRIAVASKNKLSIFTVNGSKLLEHTLTATASSIAFGEVGTVDNVSHLYLPDTPLAIGLGSEILLYDITVTEGDWMLNLRRELQVGLDEVATAIRVTCFPPEVVCGDNKGRVLTWK